MDIDFWTLRLSLGSSILTCFTNTIAHKRLVNFNPANAVFKSA